MQKYKFSNPLSVVEVSTINPGVVFSVYSCLCRGFRQNNHAPRKTYQIGAPTPNRAARRAFELYKRDCNECDN